MMRAGRAESDRGAPARWRIAACLVAALAAWTAAPAAPTARDLAQRGRLEMEAGRLDAALESLRAARERVSASVPDRELGDALAAWLYNLGVQFNNAGRPDEALSCFIQCLRLGTAAPRLRLPDFQQSLERSILAVGDFLVKSGKTESPIEAYGLLVEHSARRSAVWLALGDVQLARGAATEAAAAYRSAAMLDPASAAAVGGQGRAAALAAARAGAAGREEERLTLLESAAELLRRCAEMGPASARHEVDLSAALADLGAARGRAGRPVEAEQALAEAESARRRAVAIDPADPGMRLDLAVHLMSRRRHEEASGLLAEAERDLSRLLAERPADRMAATWGSWISACRQNRAAAAYNLALDALNTADFERADRLLADACSAGAAWEPTCRSVRQAAARRRETFETVVRRHESALREHPDSAPDLLALGDLYAAAGDYDRALAYYRRVEGGRSADPRMADRIFAVERREEGRPVRRTVDIAGGRRVALIVEPGARLDELERAVKAAWLRVSSVLGQDGLGDGLTIEVQPNQRAFRERAGYRVGSLVKGHYSGGRVSVYDAPSRAPVEWVSVLTHEMSHHAVEVLSGGEPPWWLGEGVARYVEGDTEVVDAARLSRRLAAGSLPPLARLDDLFDRSWNEPEGLLDARDVALLAVAEAARRGGPRGLRSLLLSLRGSADRRDGGALERALRGALGLDLPALDEAWRATLRRS